MIQFHFKDEIYYLKDENFSISSLMIIMILLFPNVLTMSIQNKDKYKELTDEIKGCIFEINRLLMYYSYVMIFCLIIRFMYMDDKLSINGFLYDKDVKIDCSDKSFDCCEIYDNCYNDNNEIKSDTYVYNIKKGKECNTFSEIINLNYEEEECEKSEFGCCYIRTTCDSYMRGNYTYNDFNFIINKGYPYGYENTGIKKIDREGTNCNNLEDIIIEHVNKNNDNIFSLIIIIIIMFIIINISIINREKIKMKFEEIKEKYDKKYNNKEIKNEQEYNDLTLEPEDSEELFNDVDDVDDIHP